MNSKSTHHHKRFEHLLIIRQLVDELEVNSRLNSFGSDNDLKVNTFVHVALLDPLNINDSIGF